MYNGHFHFREPPFGITPDPQLYYSNGTNRDLCASICRGIAGNQGLFVVTGEPGTGKTTLLRKVLQSFGPDIESAYLPQTLLEDTSLIPLVLDDLRIPKTSAPRNTPKEQLRRFLIEQSRKGKRVALLIDEAQNLSLDCLNEIEELSGWEAGSASLLRIVLAGQPELAAKLEDPLFSALRQRTALRCSLGPLHADEVEPYIDARLQAADRRAADLFDSKALALIARFSSGIPRLINLLCDRGLLVAYADSASKVSAAMVREAALDLQLGVAPEDSILHGDPRTAEPHGSEEFPRSERTVFAVAVDHPQRRSRFFGAGRSVGQTLAAAAIVLVLLGASALYWTKVSSPGAQPSAHVVARFPASTATSATAADVPVHPFERASATADSGVSALAAAAVTRSSPTQDKLARSTPQTKEASEKILSADIPPPQSPAAKAPREDAEPASRPLSYTVVGPSFVRAQPTADAEIIATLEPGAQLRVTGRSGQYFRIRASGEQSVAGFVHREDAFFERKR